MIRQVAESMSLPLYLHFCSVILSIYCWTSSIESQCFSVFGVARIFATVIFSGVYQVLCAVTKKTLVRACTKHAGYVIAVAVQNWSRSGTRSGTRQRHYESRLFTADLTLDRTFTCNSLVSEYVQFLPKIIGNLKICYSRGKILV